MMDKYINWISLINTDGVGPITFWKLVSKFGSVENAILSLGDKVRYDLAQSIVKKYKNNIILADDPCYPKALLRHSNRPPILFYRGDKTILKCDAVGIIGARNASIGGKSIAYDFAYNISNSYAIISGMAKGIDASAHTGAINNNGKTIAVLPLGLENIYPVENERLYHQIEERGVIISEHIKYNKSDPSVFRLRNRIVAGMSTAMIIIEAALKSGTMQTANMALDMGCDIFVVPGTPLDPRSHGGNYLIKNGAPLVEKYNDVLDLIGAKYCLNDYNDGFQDVQKLGEQGDDICIHDKLDITSMVLESISHTPVSIEAISESTQIDIATLLGAITTLELEGKIMRNGMNMLVLR